MNPGMNESSIEIRTALGTALILCLCLVAGSASSPTLPGASAEPRGQKKKLPDSPAALSRAKDRPFPTSKVGGGNFGTWRTDRFGLPTYDLTTDAISPGGSPGAWHQLGNDRIIANAHSTGRVELWSQERRYQWTNRFDPANGHYSGGYGYLNLRGEVIPTLYEDRPTGSRASRSFGTGYSRNTLRTRGIEIDQHVFAPFGDDPLLIHQVTLRNTTSTPISASWFEYWDVNPFAQSTKEQIGFGSPIWNQAKRSLTVTQTPDAGGGSREIFAAILKGAEGGYETSAPAFFGQGGPGTPDAVAADRLENGISEPNPDGETGSSLFAFRSPVSIPPGKSVTLRYAYGAAAPGTTGKLIGRHRKTAAPLESSQRAWSGWTPRIEFGKNRPWLSRELHWDGYMLRSGSTYEECRGAHVISQGGYYTYDTGKNLAYRDPLQHMLPMIYADPALARDVLLYSAQQQPKEGVISSSMDELCQTTVPFAESNDPDLWLLLSAAEYGLATRDRAFFSRQVSFQDGGRASMWSHLKRAFRHQESLRTSRGAYLALMFGDWADYSPAALGMTESALVTAQLAYVYPRMADLARMRGDRAFARELTAAGQANLNVTRSLWTGKGWFARGYAGDRLLGEGTIYGEPQPWALLAGAAGPARSRVLIGNIRRYLTGIGAPGGPSPIGSAAAPAENDPGASEHTAQLLSGGGSAVFPGQTWFAVNGWLVWALAGLGDAVPGAGAFAFDEFLRNTLANHATAYPDQWSGTISVDDMCRSWYAEKPGRCGVFEPVKYVGQIMHQPAWSLFDAIKLAGVVPVSNGYRIEPNVPATKFSLRMRNVGVAYDGTTARGYIRPARGGRMTMSVEPPITGTACRVWVDGRPVPSRRKSGSIQFGMASRSDRTVDWAIRCGRGKS